MLAIAVGASVRPAPRMRSTLSMKPIVSCKRPVNPNSSGRPRRAARVRRLLAARRAGLRFGVTTRKPVPPFGSSASVPWTTLISVHRTFTFSRPPKSGRPRAWIAAGSCGQKHSKLSPGYGLSAAVHESGCGPSRYIARPHYLGRSPGIAEIDRPPPGAEDDAGDPQPTNAMPP